MNVIKLLLVEDDEAYSFILKGSLELTGFYEVYTASNGEEGLEAYYKFMPEVIVSDIEMPLMNGMDMVKKIRQTDDKILILFTTARTSPKDLIDGLNLGVDTYIRKPFLPEELNAHIQALLKRSSQKFQDNKSKKEIYPLGNYLFNFNSRHLYWKGEQINLTEREAKILLKLYQNKGEIVKRQDILIEFWGINDFYTSRSLDVFIRNLRRYIANDDSVEIQTIRNEGLRLHINES
ncbi:MAG: response regulator transcription factor [Prevotellaceae bacterium]|jgi:DNA-binding response OmpR family regulator|nr:response regulator transcription factor [Prevotellaceae bacterium]